MDVVSVSWSFGGLWFVCALRRGRLDLCGGVAIERSESCSDATRVISSLIAGLWKSLIVDCDAMVDGRCGLNGLRRKMDASEVLGPHLSLSILPVHLLFALR